MIAEIIRKQIEEALKQEGYEEVPFVVEITKDLAHGDFASNVAMIIARSAKGLPAGKAGNPSEIAEKLVQHLGVDKDGYIEKVEVASPGFINFYLSKKYLQDSLSSAISEKEKFGWSRELMGKKVMVEYTDPNVFKPFHIGHLMSNAIGESLSRLYESAGAAVTRVNYFSDVGLAIAKAVWGMKESKGAMPQDSAPVVERTDFLGKAYAFGVAQSENPDILIEIKEINRQIYQKQSGEYLDLYNTGRRWSLEHFELLYKKLDSHFDYLIPESEIANSGFEISARALREGVFIESEGAVVFPAERSGLHTRVFITKEQLPTYEAKELGLTAHKYELVPFDQSVVITASEQSDYFGVVLKAIDALLPELAGKTRHVAHGMMRLASGKMSSRTGNIVAGQALIDEVEKAVSSKNPDPVIVSVVAIGAIKYSILKQQPGKDIIFDMERSVSVEGDSGPYLQYATVRARSVLRKGVEAGLEPVVASTGHTLEHLIGRLPDVLASAREFMAPQILLTYLVELASSWNSYYASTQVIVEGDTQGSRERLGLVAAIAETLASGLWTIGITVPERM
ncbi:MAG TPA: arginine--tRNA ligase [Candidatus Paceibacterota bacterium]